ncbi:MAG: hypothetical protein IPK13_05590 [Deltaproteobacteria bacterium]|nr:hypothetical protein [Deltaproteobacteria bacterium]
MNEFVVRMAHAEGFVDPSLCVADTTAQEAPMTYPTEVGLIGTFFKRVACLGKRAGRAVSSGARQTLIEDEDRSGRLYKHRFSADSRSARQALVRRALIAARGVERTLASAISTSTHLVESSPQSRKFPGNL